MSFSVNPGEADFLDLLYGAAVRRELWTTVLERFADMVGGSNAYVSRTNIVDGAATTLGVRLDPEMGKLYAPHFARLNVLNNVQDPQRYIASWDLRIITDEDWMPKDALVRTEYYNDFMRVQDVHSALMIRLGRQDLDVFALNVGRPERHGQFEGADIEVAGRYHAHLVRALRLSRTFAADRALDDPDLAGFEASVQALFELDVDGRVLRFNRAAERLVAEGCLSVLGNRLTVAHPMSARRLGRLIDAAGRPGDRPRTGGTIHITRPDLLLPLAVSVAPIGQGPWALFGPAPSILVSVADPQAGPRVPERRLRELFDLTAAESRVAMAMLDGARPREAAAALGVSVNTLRTHLRRIFGKTGTDRQSALVALMLRVSERVSERAAQ